MDSNKIKGCLAIKEYTRTHKQNIYANNPITNHAGNNACNNGGNPISIPARNNNYDLNPDSITFNHLEKVLASISASSPANPAGNPDINPTSIPDKNQTTNAAPATNIEGNPAYNLDNNHAKNPT